ncbi:IclR family transcriptional regulator C-terminal domain-containing protein [Nocardia sp. NPDC047654]|uniref:IclR family transcriptional regulator domain-containing protein n=1 Tax=Nocardia sp. NPDC047654 TaxID=3364314 RepID=UPI003720CD15
MGADGYCIVDQELEEGLRSLAAPIRDHIGAVIAAVNISTQAARYSAAAVRKYPAAAAARDRRGHPSRPHPCPDTSLALRPSRQLRALRTAGNQVDNGDRNQELRFSASPTTQAAI